MANNDIILNDIDYLEKNPNASLKEYLDYRDYENKKYNERKRNEKHNVKKFIESLNNSYHIIEFDSLSVIILKINKVNFYNNNYVNNDSDINGYKIFFNISYNNMNMCSQNNMSIDLRWLDDNNILDVNYIRDGIKHNEITEEQYNKLANTFEDMKSNNMSILKSILHTFFNL